MAQADWPGTSGLPAVASRAGYALKSLQLPFATGNGETDAPEILWGAGSPQGSVLGAPGDLYADVTNGLVYRKGTGTATNTGWAVIGFAVDAKGFGAIGDGIANDRPALQLAATSAGAGSGILYIPAGTYLVATQVYVPAGVIVIGAGRGVTIVRRKSSSITNGDANNTGAVFMAGPSDGTLYVVGAHGAKLSYRDLTVDGNGGGNPGITNANLGCHGIRTHFVDDLQLLNVEVINCLSSGTYTWGCRRSLHHGCAAHGNGLISVADSRNGFHVTGPQDDATDQGAQDEHIFSSCESYSNTDEGITVGRNGRIVVSGCSVHDNGDMGIEGDSSTATSDTTSVPAGWAVTGNHIYNNTNHGVSIANANAQRVTVTGNVIENHTKSAITTAQSSGALLTATGNVLVGFGSANTANHGLIVGSGFAKVVVSNNLIDGTASSLSTGLVLLAQAAARYVKISDNLFGVCGGGYIAVTGQATGSVTGNACIGGTLAAFSDGIVVSGGTAGISNLDVSDNTVLDSQEYGLRIRTNGAGNVVNVRVRHNTCTSPGATQTYGLAIAESTGTITGLYLEGNDFSGNVTGRITGAPAAGFVGRPRDAIVTLTDASTIVVDASAGTVFEVTPTANRTMGLPSNPGVGQRAQFVVIQDGSGGHTVNFATNFPKFTWSDTGNTANKRSSIAGIYDGTNWNQDGAQTPYV